ncbi:MAG: DUF1592 domain-containing protein, partial [Novosphingobium sp.]|nr:DUF1592 domain-containing protein [Novosphingobium sp.]
MAAPAQNHATPAVEPLTEGALPGFRRLNEDQYKRSIEQIFGADIEVPGRFAPPFRDDGLMAIGSNRVTVTPSGIEQYELRASEIAAQVLGEGRRDQSVGCIPKSADEFDEACAARFFEAYGKRLYRRPVSSREMSVLMSLGRNVTASSGDFYKGLEFGLSRLLLSPNFVFRVEKVADNSGKGSISRLDDYSLGTRISFLLWDAPPDDELLDAAGRGHLADPTRLARHVDRMIASPRFEQGVRSFFSDML